MEKRIRDVLLRKTVLWCAIEHWRKPESIKTDETTGCGKKRDKGHTMISPWRNTKPNPHHDLLCRGAFRTDSGFERFSSQQFTFHEATGKLRYLSSVLALTGPLTLSWSRLHSSHLSSKQLGLDNHYTYPFQVFLLHYHFTMFQVSS